MLFKRVVIALILVIAFACQSSEVVPANDRIGLHYYPLDSGTFRIYDIYEINFKLAGNDTANYQLRETIVDFEEDSNDEVSYQVLREVRIDSTGEWESDSIWTIRSSSQRLISVENNVPFVKLVFPLENNLTWDGNAYNVRSTELYRYERLVADTVLYEQVFSDLWMVVQSDLGQDILGRDDRYEVYAPNVGLIIKNSIIWSFCQTDCSTENQVVAGRELRQSLISYGISE